MGGGLALLKTGDRIRIDLNTRKVDVLLPEGELEARRAAWQPPKLVNMTPWEEIYRSMVGPARHRRLPGAGDAVSQRDRDARGEPEQPLTPPRVIARSAATRQAPSQCARPTRSRLLRRLRFSQ